MKNKWINTSALLGGGLISLCCGVPLALAILGIGGLSFGNYIADYHWLLTIGGAIAVGLAWFIFLREKKKAHNMGARLDNERFTKTVLSLVTIFVVGFVSFNTYSQLNDDGGNAIFAQAHGEVSEIKVSGMTCATCELHIEGELKKVKRRF